LTTYIDANLVLKKTIAFEEVKHPHSGLAVDEYFGGDHLHVRCCAHILNILVQDRLAVAHRTIDKIRELVKHINSSPS
jgi:hypothetical protein